MSRSLARSQNCIYFSARVIKLDDELLKFGKRFGVFGNEIPSMAEPFDQVTNDDTIVQRNINENLLVTWLFNLERLRRAIKNNPDLRKLPQASSS